MSWDDIYAALPDGVKDDVAKVAELRAIYERDRPGRPSRSFVQTCTSKHGTWYEAVWDRRVVGEYGTREEAVAEVERLRGGGQPSRPRPTLPVARR